MSELQLESLTPDQHQELLAGYVLGDLDPEELSLFQQLLAREPTLMGEVQQLQETLGAIPYGLPVDRPGLEVRSHLLQAATPPVPQRHHRRPWGWSIGGVVAGIALVLGLQNLSLRPVPLAQNPSPATHIKNLQASAQYVAGNWQDLDEVLADHARSVSRQDGPRVDFKTDAIADIRTLYQDRLTLPQALPQLQTVQLVGGSFCQFNRAKGLRLTYQTPTNQTVSFYQLVRSGQVALPPLNPERLYLNIDQGPNVALWHDQSFVYLLVTQLPIPDMENLAVAATPQSSRFVSLSPSD